MEGKEAIYWARGHFRWGVGDLPAFFGNPGSPNAFNLLQHSLTMEEILSGTFPPSMSFNLNVVMR